MLAILFMLPNTFYGRWAFRPENPPFFTHDLAKRWLSPGANVLILPYGFKGESMLWQEESHFYFSMAGGYLDLLRPKSFTRYPAIYAFYDGHSIGANYREELVRFIRDKHVAAIMIADCDMPTYAALAAPLHIKPIHTGGIELYLIPAKCR